MAVASEISAKLFPGPDFIIPLTVNLKPTSPALSTGPKLSARMLGRACRNNEYCKREQEAREVLSVLVSVNADKNFQFTRR